MTNSKLKPETQTKPAKNLPPKHKPASTKKQLTAEDLARIQRANNPTSPDSYASKMQSKFDKRKANS